MTLHHLSDVDAFLAVLDGRSVDLPDEYSSPEPRTDNAAHFLEQIRAERLTEASEAVLSERCKPLLPTVIALLHHAGHQATSEGRLEAARTYVGRLHDLLPNDISIRLWMASLLNSVVDADRIVALFEPILPELLKYPDSYAPYFRFLVSAAIQIRRIDLIGAVAERRPKRTAHSEAWLEKTYSRAATIIDASPIVPKRNNDLDPLGDELVAAMLTLDEYGMLQRISAISRVMIGLPVPSETILQLLFLAGVTRANGWSRAYREALRLAARVTRSEDYDNHYLFWNQIGLPEEGYDPFFLSAMQTEDIAHLSDTQNPPSDSNDMRSVGLDSSNLRDETLLNEIAAFERTPTLEQAKRTWSIAYLTGHHKEVALFAPSSREKLTKGSRARGVVHAPVNRGNETPLWILMTWLKDADRILRVLAAYVGQTTVVLSIGGDGNPIDLRRASALLLVDDVHLLSRPVVSWGAQQGGFHNFLEVMEAFRTSATKDAWLQTVCDRTYPLQNLQRFRQWTGDTRHLGMSFGFGPPSWKYEWPEDVVENLAERYHSALDEIFRAGRSSEFVELATKSQVYGNNDNRLYPSIFNFSDKPQSVDPNSWHNYMISSLEIDVRWMSFARLQGLVDVSTEVRTTYTRRHHPLVTAWVKNVLIKYDLRTGSNWGYMSRNYAETVLSHPGLPELFSALDLGFAPEMNFFDTIGASLKLDSDFGHLFHVFPENEALDSEIPAACLSADRDEFAFVRKTNPLKGAEFIRFFADRILEDAVAESMHWVVPNGELESGIGDPRPTLNSNLIECLFDCKVRVRDLLDRSGVSGRFSSDGRIVDSYGAKIADWVFEADALRVTYFNQQWGTKQYNKIGGSAKLLTLVPSELVMIGNAWSAFLDFDLEGVSGDPALEFLVVAPELQSFQQSSCWYGSGNPHAALMAAFSDATKSSFPTPTIEARGSIHEVRTSTIGQLALASVNGFPTLLSVSGFAQAERRTMLELVRASEEQEQAWDDALEDSLVPAGLRVADIPGNWIITTLYTSARILLHDSNWVYDGEGAVVGRWAVRSVGLLIFGLDGVVFGLADNYRFTLDRWRLSGWGWRNMKDAVTFALVQCIS